MLYLSKYHYFNNIFNVCKKKCCYVVLFCVFRNLYPDLKQNLDSFKHHLEESSNEMAPLKVWQFQELSLQAAERIMSAPKDEALKVFTYIAQNFPMQVRSHICSIKFNMQLKF